MAYLSAPGIARDAPADMKPKGQSSAPAEGPNGLWLSAITSFFRFVQSIHPEHMLLCQQILSIQFKKRQFSSVDYLSIEAVEMLLQQPNARKPMGRRDLVLLSVLYDTGARVQELANMNVSDLKLTAPATARLLGKGGVDSWC
ncbi:hypothetical protein [Achromobacter aegrifaciens]